MIVPSQVRIWLDDQIDDPETPDRHVPIGFVGARSSTEAIFLVNLNGLPEFLDLDHDLGGPDTAMQFLYWLARTFPDGPVPGYRVHSQNPVGALNIEAFMRSWQKSTFIK